MIVELEVTGSYEYPNAKVVPLNLNAKAEDL